MFATAGFGGSGIVAEPEVDIHIVCTFSLLIDYWSCPLSTSSSPVPFRLFLDCPIILLILFLLFMTLTLALSVPHFLSHFLRCWRSEALQVQLTHPWTNRANRNRTGLVFCLFLTRRCQQTTEGSDAERKNMFWDEFTESWNVGL